MEASRATPARESLRRRGRLLEWLTLALCGVEAGVGIGAGQLAASAALMGFGLQSLIEGISGGTMLWRLREGRSGAGRSSELRALRIIGVSLFLVALYIAWDAGRDLFLHVRPSRSLPGIALAIFSLISMPLLAASKRSVARGLHSAALRADAVHTDVCTWQAGIMLVGLGLHTLLGWWWMDPAAALVMVPFIVREGVRALRGEGCGCVECFEE
jgi:divalent metal cation (Fe/Co/Zn/Cd) transporter